MFCAQCGEKVVGEERFCTHCGYALILQDTQSAIAIAVQLKEGLLKRKPYVLWMDGQKIAWISIGEKQYAKIVTESSMQPMTQKDLSTEAASFRNFALQLAEMKIEELLLNYPGSVLFNNEDIQKMNIVATYDSDLRHFDDYERVIIKTTRETYKGVIEKDTQLSQYVIQFERWFGSRYQYMTMEGFPFF